MNTQSYIDPYQLFEISAKEALDLKLIRKKKREALAEFELNDLAEISLAGRLMNKSEVIALFESFESEQVLTHYGSIQQMPAFQAFLEKGEIAFFEVKHYEPFLQKVEREADFAAFTLPFFIHRFDEKSLEAFNKEEPDQLQLMFAHPLWMALEHQQRCIQSLDKKLGLMVQALEQFAKQMEHGNASPGAKVQEVVDENQIELLNALPVSLEYHRNAYARALEGLALAIFNTYQRAKLAKYILKQGLKLKINTDTIGRLEYVLDQLLVVAPDEQFGLEDIQEAFEKAPSKQGLWKWALGGFVLYVLLKVIF